MHLLKNIFSQITIQFVKHLVNIKLCKIQGQPLKVKTTLLLKTVHQSRMSKYITPSIIADDWEFYRCFSSFLAKHFKNSNKLKQKKNIYLRLKTHLKGLCQVPVTTILELQFFLINPWLMLLRSCYKSYIFVFLTLKLFNPCKFKWE